MANKELLLIKKSSSITPAQIVNRSGEQKKTSAPVKAGVDKKISSSTSSIMKSAEKDIASHITATNRKNSISTNEVAQLKSLLDSLTDNQRKALDDAIASNPNAVAKNKGRSLENDKVWQYANAIVNLTDADGNVNYKASKYEFNPYTNGQPDEIARKAFDSLSVEDQLRLEISDTGKPKTPKFGDPNADLTAYENYQKALAKAEQDAIDKADSDAVKAMENAYRNNRGNYEYDAKVTAKAIKDSNKQVSYTQSELVDLYEALQDKYDWDDEAYAEWNTPAPFTNASNKIVSTQNVKRERENPAVSASTPTTPVMTEYVPGAAAKIVAGKSDVKATAEAAKREAEKQAAPTFVATDAEPAPQYDSVKAAEAYFAAKDAGASDDEAWKAAYSAVYTPEELAAAEKARDNYMAIKGNTAFMRTMAKLTGKDKIEYWARANKNGSFENDAKYMANQAVQGIGDVVSGIALLAGGATWATINAATSTSWLIANGGKPWSMDELRSRFAPLDDIMYVAETSGSGKYNTLNEAGKEKAGEVAQFIGNLGRSFMSSTTSGAMGAAIGAAFPKLTTTLSLSNALGDKASPAVKTLAKVVPDVQVGINQLPFLTQSFASGYNEALATGYDQAGALVWGSWTALAEGIPESISWNWSAATGSNLKSQVYGSLNKDAAKTATKKGLKNLMARIGESGAAKVLAALNAEGMSEVMTNYLDWFGRKTLMNQDVDLPTLRDNLATYGTGALLSAITQGFSYAASTPARKQAEAIVDGMVNGQAPTSEQVQALDDSLNDAAAHEPISNERLDELSGEGLKVDEKTTEAYRAANDAFYKAEQAATAALQRLQQMNEQGVPFGSPERVAAVKDYVESRKEYASASQKRKDAHAKFLNALDGMVQETEAAAAEAEAEQQRIAEEYAEWQYTEMLQNDPKGLLTVATELQNAVNEDLVASKTALHQAGFADPATRTDLMLQVKNLQASNVKLQEMIDTATTAIAPTIVEETIPEQDGTNTAPVEENAVQGAESELEREAQDFVATMRMGGQSTEDIIAMVDEQANDPEADERDVAFAEAVKAIVQPANNTAPTYESLAQQLIAENASRAKESRVADLLNTARQEMVNGNTKAADETGIAMAREILTNTGAVDTSADAIKTAIRGMSIAPTAEERANIAATYGSYDAYRRAVAGVVPMGGVGKANSVSIDQAIGALQQQFPGQVTGDDRAQWLYEFAQNNPKGKVNYDGDLDADAAQLWEQVKRDNADYFTAKEGQPAFAVPDFTDKATKYSKAAAAEWIAETERNGTSADEIRNYAERRRYTELNARGRQFWGNVLEATQKPGTQAFKPTADEALARDTIHLFTGTSPYAEVNGMRMHIEESTYPTNRKWSALKNELQDIIGFTFNDEYYNRGLRREGAIAYFEPAHNFVSTSDTNNMTAVMHEAGHAVNNENVDPDEAAVFLQTMPATFINQYDERVRPAEAAAEMFRAWLLNPDSMEREYPNTFNNIQRSLGRRRYNQLRETGNAIRRMMSADPTAKINAALHETTERKRVDVGQELRNAIKTTADAGFGLKKIDRAAQRAGITIAGGSADARASQARTASQAVEALFFDGMYDRQGNRVACSLSECIQGLRSEQQYNDFLAYLEVMQALDRYNANNADWVFSNDVCTVPEARAFARRIESTQPEIVESANNVWKWLKNYRNTNLSTAIPASVKAEWERLNPHYIPQTRHFTNEIRSAVRGGGVGGQGTGVNQRRVGSTRDIVNPIDAIANMVARTKTAAMQHDVLTALQDYYGHDVNGVIGSFMHEIEPDMVPTVVPADVVRRHVVNAQRNAGWSGIDPQALNNELEMNLEDMTVFQLRAPNGRAGDAIAITENGNTRYFQIYDQDLLNSLTNMPAPQLGIILGGTQKMSSMINSLITSKNPAFALGNAVRDAQEAYFTGSTQNPIVFAWDYLGALADVVGNTEVARQYRAMGGSGGLSSVYASNKNINDLKRAMFGAAADSRSAGKVAVDRVGDAIESFNGAIETIPRLAEYKRQLRRGANFADAIKAAKNCTTDFSTHGSSSKSDGALWRFFNASVQSTYKAANMFADGASSRQNGRRLASQLVSMATIGVVGRALAEILLQINDDDDTYAAMPDYIKDGYWVIPTGEKGKYTRIPLPNGALMTTVNALGRRIGMTIMGISDDGNVGEVVGEQATEFLKDVLDGLSPFGEFNAGNPIGSNFTLNPLIQVQTNTSWTGAPIVPSSMEGLSKSLQYDDKTSEVAKVLGKALNMSPMNLDYLISQNSGVIGELNDAVTAGIAKGKSDGVAAGVGAGIYEFALSRFITDTAYSQQVTSGFYDERQKLQKFIDDVDSTMKRNGLPESPVMRDLNPAQTHSAYKAGKALKKQLDDMAKQLSEIGTMATKYANTGDEERAREMRFKQQALAAEATILMANYFDKWKSINK